MSLFSSSSFFKCLSVTLSSCRSLSLSSHVWLSLQMSVCLSLFMSISLSFHVSLFFHLAPSSHASVWSVCVSVLSFPLLSSPCFCVARVVLCCAVLLCFAVSGCVVCVGGGERGRGRDRVYVQNAPRVHIQNVPVCTGTTSTCMNHVDVVPVHTGRFECTHGGFFSVSDHTPRPHHDRTHAHHDHTTTVTHNHTQPRTATHNNTQHNTPHATPHTATQHMNTHSPQHHHHMIIPATLITWHYAKCMRWKWRRTWRHMIRNFGCVTNNTGFSPTWQSFACACLKFSTLWHSEYCAQKSHCVNSIWDHRKKWKKTNNETSSSTCGQPCIMNRQEHNRSLERTLRGKK